MPPYKPAVKCEHVVRRRQMPGTLARRVLKTVPGAVLQLPSHALQWVVLLHLKVFFCLQGLGQCLMYHSVPTLL